jgi:hypothetical protein
MIVLPRQARDEHRERTLNKDAVFFAGRRCVRDPGVVEEWQAGSTYSAQ